MYSIQVKTSLVEAIWAAFPASVLAEGYISFTQGTVDPTTGILQCPDEDKDTVNAVLSRDDLLTSYLKQRAAAVRWSIQNSGITVNGVPVDTSLDSVSSINATVAYMTQGNISSVDFKAGNGFVSLSLAQVTNFGLQIGHFWQACFSAEKNIGEKIDAGTYKTTDDVNEASEWPSTTITTTS